MRTGPKCSPERERFLAFARSLGYGNAGQYKPCPSCGQPCRIPAERCDACYRAEVTVAHGTEAPYKRGCRCVDCRAAVAAARKRRRHANIEATRAYDRERRRRQRQAS